MFFLNTLPDVALPLLPQLVLVFSLHLQDLLYIKNGWDKKSDFCSKSSWYIWLKKQLIYMVKHLIYMVEKAADIYGWKSS